MAAVGSGDQRRGGEVQLSVVGELHMHSGKLRGVEVEAEGAPTCLSTVTHLQWRTAVRSSGGPITKKEEDVNEVRHSLGQLFKEEGRKGHTEWQRIGWRGGCNTVHEQWGKSKMRPARCDSSH
jgi:hypothetical protein